MAYFRAGLGRKPVTRRTLRLPLALHHQIHRNLRLKRGNLRQQIAGIAHHLLPHMGNHITAQQARSLRGAAVQHARDHHALR